MIHTIRTVTVDSKKSVIDSPIVLYRGDREVEIEFSLVGSKFTFSEGGNVIKSLNAAYGQLIIHSPNPNIDIVFSEITECNDGKVVFLITKEMIDELVEVGTYDFQIRLYDATQVSRATIPPISQALDIRHPMGSEEETNVVDIAIAEYSIVRDDPFEDVMTFLPSGDYNKTEWSSNALITAARMNKIEDGLYTVNRNMEVSDTSLFNRIEKVNNNLSARLNNLGDEIATEAMDSFSDQIAQLKGTVNASILASESKVTAEMDATKESVNAELEAFEETVNAELELTRNTVEETKAAIDEAKVTVDETQSVVTELIDETRETVSSFEGVINNLDAAYKAADTTLQNNIDALDAAYKAADVEIQNSIPTKISQLENDTNITPQPGNWWSGGTPIVSDTGVTHIGGHLFFHNSDTQVSGEGLLAWGGNNFHINGGLKTSQDLAYDLGSAGGRWSAVFSHGFDTGAGGMNLSNDRLLRFYGPEANMDIRFQSKTSVEADYHVLRPDGNGLIFLGHNFHRWKGIALIDAPNVSSDRTLKENIQYIKNENARALYTDEVVTYKDMYNFVKDDLELATYNIKNDSEQQMNFIAQDLLYNLDGSDNKVGQMIVKPIATPPGEKPDIEVSILSYDSGMYTSVLAGALKEALNKIDKLEARIDELENK